MKIALIELGYDLNKNNEIELNEADTITNLKISKRNISTLEDLKYFKNLKIVNATTNNIKDINVFFGNDKIQELYIGENKLGPKLVVQNMVNLKGLYAFRNDLKEIEFIGDFKNLKSLYLQGNLFENLEIPTLTSLESLQLFECDNLKTIDIYSNLKLKQFFLMDMKVVSVVNKSENIKTIFIQKNIADIQPQHKDLKTAPVIKVKGDMIVTPN